jgi:hypothetical protein
MVELWALQWVDLKAEMKDVRLVGSKDSKKVATTV